MGLFIALSVFLVVFVTFHSNSFVVAQGNMCGVNAPDPMKTCISLRLPWQAEPIYFCIEKDKFKYKNQCGHRHMTHCGTDMRNDTLLLATPWDCCPHASIPDHCMHTHCPPAPHNRTCKTLDDAMMMDNPWDCCSRYFCEENTTPDNCHMKRLEPMCVSPPKDKMNCVGFYDPYGCCTKYQCDGEGKPGMCPMQHQAMQFAMKFNSSHHYMMNMSMGMMNGGGNMMSGNLMQSPPAPAMEGSAPPAPEAAAVSISVSKPEPLSPEASVQSNADAENVTFSIKSMKRRFPSQHTSRMVGGVSMYSSYSFGHPMPDNSMQCIGDFNCPGNMKCCSHDMTVYSDGHYMTKNMYPTTGYCMEPVMMMPVKQ